MQNKYNFFKFRFRLFLLNYIFRVKFSLFSLLSPVIAPILYSTILFFVIRGNDLSNYERYGYVFTGFFFLRYVNQSLRFIISQPNVNLLMNGYNNDYQKLFSLFLTCVIEQLIILFIIHLVFSEISTLNFMYFFIFILLSNIFLALNSYFFRVIFLNLFGKFRKIRLLVEFAQPALMFILPIFWVISENTSTFLIYAYHLIPFSIPLELIRFSVFGEFQNHLTIDNFYFIFICSILSIIIIIFNRKKLSKLKNTYENFKILNSTSIKEIKKMNYLISKLHLYFYIPNIFPIFPYKPNNILNFRVSHILNTLSILDKEKKINTEKQLFSSLSNQYKKKIFIRIYSYLNPPIKVSFKINDNK